MRIIPAIDLRDGKCVRLYQGDFARQTNYSDDPVGMAQRYSGLAVRDLHLVDLDGALTGDRANANAIERITAETTLEVQVGGGLRSADALEQCFAAGAARCVIGSMAIIEPAMVRDWIRSFGPDRIVLAFDVIRGEDDIYRPATKGWTATGSVSLEESIDGFLEVGLKHVLCTDISRDGALTGPNVELYASLLGAFPEIELQASGGVRNIGDLEALRDAGLPAAITGRALLDGKITSAEVASFQQGA